MNPDTGSKLMNKNILIVLAGAVLAAVLVAVLVQVTLGGKKEKIFSDSSAVVEVLVAARDLKATAEIKDGDTVWKSLPKDMEFKGAIIRKEDQKADGILEGRYSRDVSAGEPIKMSMALKAKGNFVAASLAAGERAISLKLKTEDMVAGFIGPGTFVDVIVTYEDRFNSSNDDDPRVQQMYDLNIKKYATETILQNIRVVAIDQTYERDFDDEVKAGKTVTLAVPFPDVEKIALASQMGKIVLVLRGVDDKVVEVETARPALTDARMTKIRSELFAEYKRLHGESGKDASVSINKAVSIKVYNGSEVISQQTSH